MQEFQRSAAYRTVEAGQSLTCLADRICNTAERLGRTVGRLPKRCNLLIGLGERLCCGAQCGAKVGKRSVELLEAS